MKIKEFLDKILVCSKNVSQVDGIKVGDASAELKGVGITMFPTTSVIKKCVEKGINLLIAREPLTYSLDNGSYSKTDEGEFHQISKNKIKMLEDAKITLFRLHDTLDVLEKNPTFEGFIKYLGLKGKEFYGNHDLENFTNDHFIFDSEITAKEFAKVIEEKTPLAHVKISGSANAKVKTFAFCNGIGRKLGEEIENNDCVITGELTEFFEAELTHEYAEQGHNKCLLILGHYGTEVLGVKLVAESLIEKFPEIKIEYIECGDSYSYVESK
ncbi:MAG: Nif3-like dinuclear metal center hexameric protein [Clostridia bacterium]|nr:Nif3-like dinuclear metal center hexameric protein [Clostridia bacterium]